MKCYSIFVCANLNTQYNNFYCVSCLKYSGKLEVDYYIKNHLFSNEKQLKSQFSWEFFPGLALIVFIIMGFNHLQRVKVFIDSP